ncbi:MAG: AI-2E family transporter [Chitinophagaceae bacterium]|nr:MAG: AI-2E family transporter [Chitinophagaceae bacterium]
MNNIDKRYQLAKKVTFYLLAAILFLYAIIAVRNFLYPIAFGFLLAYLAYPIVNWLEKKRVPRIVASFITIISTLAVFGGIAIFVIAKFGPFAEKLPEMVELAMANLIDQLSRFGSAFGLNPDETKIFVESKIEDLMNTGDNFFGDVFSTTANTIFTFAILPVYIFLFLYYRTKFAYFMFKITPKARKADLINILRQISKVSAQYLWGVLIVVLILMIINTVGLTIVGVKYALPLGIISALFNFIPYFGTLLGGAVPLLFAILVENDIALAFKVLILFIIIQFIENNILTPNIVGSNVKVNPFFIITGLVGASMVWGIPGMLLIVPFLAISKIVFSHIESMKPFAFLLGEEGTAKHAIQFKKLQKYLPFIKKSNPDV